MTDYNLNLTGKVALVTGGSRGIGKAIALAFASKGAKVAITFANSSSSADQVAKEIIELGTDALPIQANSSDFNRANEVIDEVVQKWGKIDILVNNAGITRDGLILRMTEDQWDQVIETNLKGILGHQVFLQWLNRSKFAGNYKDYYNDYSKRIVAEHFGRDIEYYGFKFETEATKNVYRA